MAFSNAAKALMLNALKTGNTYASIHTASPGLTGASEVAGGDYARVQVTFTDATADNLDSSNAPQISIPASTTVAYFGVWTAATAGTFLFGGALSASETFTAAGTYTLNDVDANLNDA